VNYRDSKTYTGADGWYYTPFEKWCWQRPIHNAEVSSKAF